VSLLWQLTLLDFFNRSRPVPPEVKPPPLLITALPMAVWEDHLLPLLTGKDAARRLGRTCKALRMVVREHFRGDLGTIPMDKLKAALTTLPRARSVGLRRRLFGATDVEALVQWLHEGGRGRHLTTVQSVCGAASHFVYTALRGIALPSLNDLEVDLQDKPFRELLRDGFLEGIHRLRVTLNCSRLHRVAVLGLVWQLPALTKLELRVKSHDVHHDHPVQWPSFIPPSLKALRIDLLSVTCSVVQSTLAALPGMLGASGARLDRLELHIPYKFEAIGDGLLDLAQALRCCSPTLKAFILRTSADSCIRIDPSVQDHASQMERLRVEWAGVLAGVSACRELEVLVLPRIEVEPLFPPGTAFGRLTHLEISDHAREHPPGAGMMGVWELMASGGLPALAKLSVRLEGRWVGVEDVRSRVAPALAAVGGTLTQLVMQKVDCDNCVRDEVELGHELGVAVGKLRRLKDLELTLSDDGRAYLALTQGLTVSGGNCPLPVLWRVVLPLGVATNADLLASLLLPTVRIFVAFHRDARTALLAACAVRQAGYKHTYELVQPYYFDPDLEEDALDVIAYDRSLYLGKYLGLFLLSS
jgi:hypothetical protein